jgi:hypothetical protein
MSQLIFYVLLLFINTSRAEEFIGQTGDIILLPLNCYMCPVIEDETGAPYSHSGVIIRREEAHTKNFYVAEALGAVALIPLKQFLKKSRIPGSYALYRHREFLADDLSRDQKFYDHFMHYYQDRSFDPDFLWNNRDALDNELLYCSELVAKFLNHFVEQKLRPKKMSYKKNPDFWRQYFKGNIPAGKKGLSPADFTRFPFVIKVYPLPLE